MSSMGTRNERYSQYVPPTIDHAKRAQVLDKVVEYLAELGLSELSLRPLAAASGTSARMLMHYFGSKEHMIITALEALRPEIDDQFGAIRDAQTLRDQLYTGWMANTTGPSARGTNVVLQVLGDACARRGPFQDYANAAITTLVDGLSECLRRLETPVDDPHSAATLLVSGLRGLILDRLITGDTDRTDRAALRLINQTIPVATASDAR